MNDPLRIAVEEGRYDDAKFLLMNGADVNAAREDTLTPIHIAASAGNKHLAELLLKAGANVNAKTVESKTPLHLAVGDLAVEPRNTVTPKRKYLYLTKLLLSYGANVNARTAESNTPLHIAIRCNNVGFIPLLLKKGADVDAEDGRGCTPLYLAVESGYPTMLSYILKSRPDLNNKSNQSALSIAVRRQSDEIIKKLLHYGIPVKPEDATNRSIVSCVIRNGFTKTATEIFRYGTTTALDSGLTPLHLATFLRRKAIVEVLVGHGADVNAKDFEERTPIYFATLNADYDLVELFLSKNATVRDNLVHLAARSGSLEILRVLLKLCDVNCRDEKRRTALHCVNISVEPDQMSTLVAHLKRLSLSPSDFVSRTEIARFLLANGADVNARDMYGQTPLHVAVKEGLESIVKVLLEYQADLNPVDVCGQTALENSIKPESLDVTRLLLKAGANVNTQPGEPSPLHVATKTGCRNHVQLLLEYGANVDAVREGDTALHIASRIGDLSIVKVLLEYCADVNARGKDGTPLHTAALNVHKDIVRHLLLYGSDINIEDGDNLTPLESVSKLYCRDVLDRRPNDLVYLMASFRVLLERVVQIKCLGLFVAEANLEFLTSELPLIMTQFKTFFDWSSRLSDLVSKCEAEIPVMKAKTIGDSSVTYHDFVAKSAGQVVRLLANASIVDTLSSGLYSDQFPIYASMIRGKFEVGMRRRKLKEDSGMTRRMLEKDSRLFFAKYLICLPDYCVNRILKILKDKVLEELISFSMIALETNPYARWAQRRNLYVRTDQTDIYIKPRIRCCDYVCYLSFVVSLYAEVTTPRFFEIMCDILEAFLHDDIYNNRGKQSGALVRSRCDCIRHFRWLEEFCISCEKRHYFPGAYELMSIIITRDRQAVGQKWGKNFCPTRLQARIQTNVLGGEPETEGVRVAYQVLSEPHSLFLIPTGSRPFCAHVAPPGERLGNYENRGHK